MLVGSNLKSCLNAEAAAFEIPEEMQNDRDSMRSGHYGKHLQHNNTLSGVIMKTHLTPL